MIEKSNYIENEERYGIDYNWELIMKTYNNLGIPKMLFSASNLPIQKSTYFMLLSERAVGKTTNILLLGLVMNKIYGTKIEYIRQSDDMIKPSNALELFKTIIEYKQGAYIEKLTDGIYNTIIYHWKKYYYARVDETGKVVNKSENAFCDVLAIANNFNYKSSYNSPKGDIIIFDEFIGKNYMPNEFELFMDLLSTIIRKRKCAKIFLLANTISIVSPYFREFEVYQKIKTAKAGQSFLMKTERGTDVFFEIIQNKETSLKAEINRRYFGFNNERLASITGSSTYAISIAQHIPRGKWPKVIWNKLVIHTDVGKYRISIMNSEILGICVYCVPTTQMHTGDRQYINDLVYSKEFNKGMKWDKIDKLLIDLFRAGKWYYDCNETETIMINYFQTAIKNYHVI